MRDDALRRAGKPARPRSKGTPERLT